MCLGCAVAEGNTYNKSEKQVEYSSDKEYSSAVY